MIVQSCCTRTWYGTGTCNKVYLMPKRTIFIFLKYKSLLRYCVTFTEILTVWTTGFYAPVSKFS